jgi:hypothetical protein
LKTEVYAYSGDVKNLKKIGYQFQKLYASNYKTYHKDDIFMFVVNKMILEIDNTSIAQQVAAIDLILNNLDKEDSFWERDGVCKFTKKPKKNPVFLFTRVGNHYDWDNYFTIARENTKELKLTILQKEDSGDDYSEDVVALKANEFYLEPFKLTLDFVNRIKELNQFGLHKIEK